MTNREAKLIALGRISECLYNIHMNEDYGLTDITDIHKVDTQIGLLYEATNKRIDRLNKDK